MRRSQSSALSLTLPPPPQSLPPFIFSSPLTAEGFLKRGRRSAQIPLGCLQMFTPTVGNVCRNLVIRAPMTAVAPGVEMMRGFWSEDAARTGRLLGLQRFQDGRRKRGLGE